MRFTILAGVILLSGCATTPPAPKVVSISIPTYVPIPPELSADCPIPVLGVRTVGGAIEYAIRLKGALVACSDRMGAIRGIQGSPVH